jgi:hypothetical protein
MMVTELVALNPQAQFEQMLGFIRQAADEGWRIDSVERDLMRHLLALGSTLLGAFVAQQGDGDVGPAVTAPEGDTARRLPEHHDRRYVSIFGELAITRSVYGTREGQKIEWVPLDERLGLPAGDFSYVLEDWTQRLCLKESFAEAGQSLEMLLGLRLGTRALEQMNRVVASYALSFQAALEPPPACEEGPVMVMTADGKGVPMRRPEAEADEGPKPHHRRGKGEKANRKQMACVGAVYSIEPFVRRAEDIIDEVLRDKKAKERPRPQHKHVWAELPREFEGTPSVTAKEGLFCHLSDELVARNLGHDRPVIRLMDGERALWDAQAVCFPEAAGVLDLFHVLERLWAVAHCFHTEGSDAAKGFVEQRLRDLLQGRVGYVISGLRKRLKAEKLSSQRRTVVRSAVEYLGNNKGHMRYDEYLAAGYPIGSGVAEGACRHLVKDRMEQTGMRWTVEGAQAMLHVRALYLNDQWGDFLEHRVEQEQTRLYQRPAA